MSDVLQVLLYGLLAAASPGTLVATLVVLGTRRARANGTAFAVGFVLGQSIALGIALAVGSVTIPGSSTASAALELAVGVLLLAAAGRAGRLGRPRTAAGPSRTAQVLERLERVTPRTAFSVGMTLGVGVKRLVITVFAASAIALDAVSRAEAVGLAGLYVVVATILVVVPVALYLVAGRRADEWVASAKESLATHQQLIAFYVSLLFGVFFVIGGLVQLL